MGVLRSFASVAGTASLALMAAATASAANTGAAANGVADAAIVAEFERLSDAVMRTGQTPALAAVVVRDGAIVSLRGLGISEQGKRVVAGPDTVFRIASLSKSFAASLTALLVNERALQWEDRVQDLVPALLLKDIEGAGRLRIDDLLSHRSGLPHNTLDRALEADSPYPLLVEQLDEVTPVCSVGSCYSYQNIAFSLIGDVTFAVTGDFFTHQVEKRIFHPLGMETATYGRDALESSGDWARPHVKRSGRWQSVYPKLTYYRIPPAAGVNASARDLGQWMLAHLGHAPEVLDSELLATLHAPQIDTPGEVLGSPWRRQRVRTASYALGWRVFDYSGHRMIFHAGAVQGYRAALAMLPDHDFGVALLWNSESAVPAGLLPTLIDRELELPARDWLQLDRLTPRPAARRKRVANP
ncbi:MAG: beta-lactamase family protein [Xanthomonadales bacterium]|nr:beta-lactamase family protein [Xanthomonadales bacterium]MCC6563236.1 beta-lactamase family protein [Xanthomonadales bacterium]